MQLEELGFCGRGEAKDFATVERLSLGGELPINTSGGLLGEAYIHGMNGITECVRQLRGTSVNQVPDVEHVLVTAGTGVPTSGLILRAPDRRGSADGLVHDLEVDELRRAVEDLGHRRPRRVETRLSSFVILTGSGPLLALEHDEERDALRVLLVSQREERTSPEFGCSAARSWSIRVASSASLPGFSRIVMSCAHIVLPSRRCRLDPIHADRDLLPGPHARRVVDLDRAG